MIPSGSPRVLRAHMGDHMGRTRGEPSDIELTPIGVEWNGPRGVLLVRVGRRGGRARGGRARGAACVASHARRSLPAG